MVENLQRSGMTIGGGENQSQPSTGSEQAFGAETARESGDTRRSGRSGLDINSATFEGLESAFQLNGTQASYLINARTRIGGFSFMGTAHAGSPEL
jgi:hypothetical protein